MPNYNLKGMRIQGYDLGAGQGNTATFTFRPAATACNSGIASDFLGGPRVTTISFAPGDSASGWYQNPNTAMGQQVTFAGDMLIKNRSMYWFTLNGSINHNTVQTPVQIPVAPMAEAWLPQNLTSISTISGGNAFDSTQPVPGSTERLTLDFVVVV